MVITMPIDAIVAVPDVSMLGFYNVETGEKTPASVESTSENTDFEILAFE